VESFDFHIWAPVKGVTSGVSLDIKAVRFRDKAKPPPPYYNLFIVIIELFAL
jgi:hypothetical protein